MGGLGGVVGVGGFVGVGEAARVVAVNGVVGVGIDVCFVVGVGGVVFPYGGRC